jgi:hypothetical protein
VEGVQRLGGVGDAGLALAVVAEAGHLEDGRVEAGGAAAMSASDWMTAKGPWGRPLSRRKLFGDAVLAHRHRRGAGAHRHELGQVIQGVRRDVLELGGHRGAAFGQRVEGGEVVVGGLQVTVGDEAGRAVGSGSSTQTL